MLGGRFIDGRGPGDCTFRLAGREPELWDPRTGRIRDAVLPLGRQGGGAAQRPGHRRDRVGVAAEIRAAADRRLGVAAGQAEAGQGDGHGFAAVGDDPADEVVGVELRAEATVVGQAVGQRQGAADTPDHLRAAVGVEVGRRRRSTASSVRRRLPAPSWRPRLPCDRLPGRLPAPSWRPRLPCDRLPGRARLRLSGPGRSASTARAGPP